MVLEQVSGNRTGVDQVGCLAFALALALPAPQAARQTRDPKMRAQGRQAKSIISGHLAISSCRLS
ncbi:hypothetical protein AGR1C_Lc10148 [Agrobacterium fabacearum TT111]|nr:hypothetical protein AGR1C_Lc10148 [Agrobacterium fabacearum TT111]